MEPITQAHGRKETLMQSVLDVFEGVGIKLERKEPEGDMNKARYGAIQYGNDIYSACTYVKCGPVDEEEEALFEEYPYEINEGRVCLKYNLRYHSVRGYVDDFNVWWKEPFKGCKAAFR